MKKKRVQDQMDVSGGRKQGANLGDRFNAIVVLQTIWNPPLKRCARYSMVRCDCGTVWTVATASLRSGNTTSCGCLKSERIKNLQKLRQKAREIDHIKNQNFAYNRYMRWYIRNADKRFIKWELSLPAFINIVIQPCHYCNIKPKENSRFSEEYTQKFKTRNAKWSPIIYQQKVLTVNGIDRQDSQLPYTLKNCVPCCMDCNYGKHIKSEKDFLSWVRRVANFQGMLE